METGRLGVENFDIKGRGGGEVIAGLKMGMGGAMQGLHTAEISLQTVLATGGTVGGQTGERGKSD